MNKKIIYDLGSNNGDDIPYYLMRSDLVIAVEANPVLSDQIRNRFAEEISNEKLIVENVAIDINNSQPSVPFYVHVNAHVLSQFVKPNNLSDFKEIQVSSKNIISLIQEHGDPYYIKLDIEHFDQVLLKEIFSNNIFPPYISAESHSIDIFNIFAKFDKYKKFKMVHGHWVSQTYKDRTYTLQDGNVVQDSFPYHSAGPFGNDIDGPWLDKNGLWDLLAQVGLGWKDIHASLVD